ncbi:Anthocyanidin 3-O-galactosyltransferase f3gt1 [Sarracenia purpurea var. burkii]
MAMTISSKERHVTVLPFPFASHAGLLLGLVCRLAAAAPDVIFSFCSTKKSNKSLFSASTPENIKPYAVFDGVPEGYVSSGKHQEDLNLFLEVADESFKEAMRAAEADTGRRINCIMADAFIWFSGNMAEERGVPWVPVWTAGAGSLSVFLYTDLIRETLGIHGKK